MPLPQLFTAFDVTTVDQYNWLAGIINSIVSVKPKTFDEYFPVGGGLLKGHLIPKDLYAYDFSTCGLSTLSGLGIPVLGTGDLPDNIYSSLEVTGSGIEIYTRNYSIGVKAVYNAKNVDEGYVNNSPYTPFNYPSASLIVSSEATGFFPGSELYQVSYCHDTGLLPSQYFYFAAPVSTMDPYLVRLASMSEHSKSKDIIMPFDYDRGRIFPESINGYYSHVYTNQIILEGVHTGKIFDATSSLFRNFSHSDSGSNTLSCGSLDFGAGPRIWSPQFFDAVNLADEAGFTCRDSAATLYSSDEILRKRHLITNKNLYEIIPYWRPGFIWTKISDVKNKAIEMDIPFEFRRLSTPYKLKTSTFDIEENYSETIISSGEGTHGEGKFGGTNYGPNPYPVQYRDSRLLRNEGTYGEQLLDSLIYLPNLSQQETGFFEFFGSFTGSGVTFEGSVARVSAFVTGDEPNFIFQTRGYVPWVYEAPNFVFDDSTTGNWCVPLDGTRLISTGLTALIHHTDPSNFASFKMYRNDMVKSQTITGVGGMQTISTSLNNTPYSSSVQQLGCAGYPEPVSYNQGIYCLENVLNSRHIWHACLTKLIVQPIFKIDTDPEWKEVMGYSQGNFHPKNCLFEDHSTFGSNHKIFKKQVALAKYTPPAEEEGIGISTMRTYGIPSDETPIVFELCGSSNALCPPFSFQLAPIQDSMTHLHIEDYDVIRYPWPVNREGRIYAMTSTIPEIDLNYFTKEVAHVSSGVSIIDVAGHTLITGDADGGIYKINLFIDDVISAE